VGAVHYFTFYTVRSTISLSVVKCFLQEKFFRPGLSRTSENNGIFLRKIYSYASFSIFVSTAVIIRSEVLKS